MSEITSKEEPNTEYELLRRRIYSNTKEFWFYIHSNLLEIQKKAGDIAPDIADTINQVLNLGADHKRSLLHDIAKLEEVDGYGDWRQRESQDLSDLIQERFKFLQNPEDCDTARKLVCSLNKVNLMGSW